MSDEVYRSDDGRFQLLCLPGDSVIKIKESRKKANKVVNMREVNPIFYEWYDDLHKAAKKFLSIAHPRKHIYSSTKYDAGFMFCGFNNTTDNTGRIVLGGCLRFNFDKVDGHTPLAGYYEFSIAGPTISMGRIAPIESWLSVTLAHTRYDDLKALGYLDKWKDKMAIAMKALNEDA